MYCVPSNVGGSKQAGCGLASVALKRTGCDVWQLECQANNVTASVQSDHLLHEYLLPVFLATNQSRRTPRCAEIQPMSQQAAAATRPCRRLVLDTRARPAACPRRSISAMQVIRSTNLLYVNS